MSKKMFLVMVCVIVLVLSAVGCLITYFVAKGIVQDAQVKPQSIIMNADGTANAEEFIALAMTAQVSNGAFLGGELLATEMDVYATIQGKQVKVVSMRIPTTKVEASIQDAVVSICDIDKVDYESGSCVLKHLEPTDLTALNELVQFVLAEKEIVMKMKAPNGVQLKSFGITLPFSFEFEKTFTALGMDGALSKAKISQFNLKQSTVKELKFQAVATIHNPSIFGFTLKPSKMDIYVLRDSSIGKQRECAAEIFLGVSQTEQAFLAPQSSVNISLSGVMDRHADPNCVENFVQRYLTGKGNDVVAKMQDEATESAYLNAMLKRTVLSASLAEGYDGDLFENSILQDMRFETTNAENVFHIQTRLNIDVVSPVGEGKMEALDMDVMNVTMRYGGKAFGSLFGSGNVQAEEENALHINIDAKGELTVNMADPSQKETFARFTRDLLQSTGELKVVLQGHVSAIVQTVIGNLHIKELPLNSAIHIKGLGGLPEGTITNFNLDQSTSEAIVMDFNFHAVNPSATTMIVGPLRFDVDYKGTIVGYVQGTTDTILSPGKNMLSMKGILSPECIKTQQDKDNLSDMLSHYLTGYGTVNENLIIKARASASVTTNALLNLGFQGFEITASLKATENGLIQGLTFNSMNMWNPTHDQVGLRSYSVIETFPCLGPHGIYQVEKISIKVDLLSKNGQVLGKIILNNVVPKQGKSPFIEVLIDGIVQMEDAGVQLADFMVDFINSDQVELHLKGTADVEAFLPGFPFSVTMQGIHVHNAVALKGMNKQGVFPINVLSFDLPSNTKEGVLITIDAEFINPSIADVAIGTLVADIKYKGHTIGSMNVPDFHILQGLNHMKATGQIRAETEDGFEALEEFFNAYLAHQDSNCQIIARVAGAEWLSTVLSQTQMISTIKGMAPGIQVVKSMAFNQQVDLNVYMLRSEMPTFTGELITTMAIPFAFPVTLMSFWGTVNVFGPEDVGQLGTLVIDPTPCVGHCETTNELFLPMKASLDYTGYEQAFKTFIEKVVGGTEAVEMIIKGTLSCTISTNFNFHGRFLKLAALIDTTGFSGLEMPAFNKMGPIKVEDLRVADGTVTRLPIESVGEMCNPSSFVNMVVSDIELGVFYKGYPLARVNNGGNNIVLKKNSCTKVNLQGAIDNTLQGFSETVMNAMLTQYMNNNVTNVEIRAIPTSEYIVQDAFSRMSLFSQIPSLQCRDSNGSGCRIVTRVDLKDIEFNSFREFWARLYTKRPINLMKASFVDMWVHNPFPGTTMRPTAYYIRIDFDGQKLGHIDEGPLEIVIKGDETYPIRLKVKEMNSDVNNMQRQLKMSCDLFQDKFFIDSGEGTRLGAKIGEYEIDVGYYQKRVQISCHMNSVLQKLCDEVMKDSWLFGRLIKFGCRVSTKRRALYLRDMRRRLALIQDENATSSSSRYTNQTTST